MKRQKQIRANAKWPESGSIVAARLTPYGALIFSQAALEKFRLMMTKRCRLHFDRTRLMLAVEVVPDDAEQAAAPDTRRIYTTSGSAHVWVTSLLRTYGLETAAHTVCPVLHEEYQGMNLIAVDLKPAAHAAERGGVPMPHRPGASAVRRKMP